MPATAIAIAQWEILGGSLDEGVARTDEASEAAWAMAS